MASVFDTESDAFVESVTTPAVIEVENFTQMNINRKRGFSSPDDLGCGHSTKKIMTDNAADLENITNESTGLQKAETAETDVEINTSPETCRRGNNLELYLKDVYETECMFNIENEEVQFIQTGVEATVHQIAKDMSGSAAKMLSRYRTLFQKAWCAPRMLNVGSYYEKTKNHFPNEFDFILILGNFKEEPVYFRLVIGKLHHFIIGLFKESIAEVEQKALGYKYETPGDTRKLYVEGTVKKHGPAAQIACIYERSSGEKMTIHIDITPAFQVTNEEVLKKTLKNHCGLEPFHEEVLTTGSLVYIGKLFSFTETEVHFMKNVLSDNHAKAYRILKYFINGHGDGEKLDKYLEGKGIGKGYSSYNIKTMMIYHHYSCKNSDPGKIGPCVLAVLQEMYRYTTLEDFPCLSIPSWRYKVTCMADLCLRRYIQPMIETLKSLQETEEEYSYERDRMNRSMSAQYLDECTEPMTQNN